VTGADRERAATESHKKIRAQKKGEHRAELKMDQLIGVALTI
jgi:hypothetical protein